MEKVLNQEEIGRDVQAARGGTMGEGYGGQSGSSSHSTRRYGKCGSQAASHGIASEVMETDRKILANQMVEHHEEDTCLDRGRLLGDA